MSCLIFDSDGTLVDSELLNNEALSLELRNVEIEESPDDLVGRYRGWKFSAVLDDLQTLHDCRIPTGFTAQFRERAKSHFERQLCPVPEIPEALSALDYPMCVASNAPVDKIAVALKVTKLDQFFGPNIYSAYEVNSWKPDPDLFLHAAKAMGFDPAECVVIEDSQVGVQAASSAGITAVLYDPEGVVEQLEGAIVIRSMKQLPDTVNRIFSRLG